MELNIKRFASAGNDELYPDYSYDYTPNGYIRTATVSIVCEYDISSVLLVQGGDEINDTENLIITEDFRGRPCAKRYFHEPVDATYNIYCENNETPFSVSVYVANDFQPESEQYPIILNHDVKISDSNTKLKNVADVVENYFDYIYPIGSVYKSASAINPQNIFGGTWTQITEDTIVAYGYVTGTTLSQSKNISSITSLGSGAYQVAFSKTMANANFKAFVSGECNGIGSEIIGVYNQTTSGFRYDFANYNGTATTPTSVNIVVIGKLANPEYYEWKRTA